MAGAKKAGRYFTVGETTYAPGDEVPAEVVALVDNPDVWKSVDDEPEPAGATPIADMTKAQLKAELAARNGARVEADAIVVEGNATKADILAALQADDAAQA